MEAIETEMAAGYKVSIHYDEYAESPRTSHDQCDVFVLAHGRYDLPNESGIDLDDYDGWQAVETALRADYDAAVVLPVHGYEHGALALTAGARIGQFADPWDSGVAGLVYVTHETLKREWEGDEDAAAAYMRGMVEEFSDYLNGSVYGFTIEDQGEVVESCWGLYGEYDYVLAEARAAAEALDAPKRCNGRLNRDTGEIEHHRPCPIHAEEASEVR